MQNGKRFARQFLRKFSTIPTKSWIITRFQTYTYSAESSDASFDRNKRPGRIHLAIMLDDEPVGEVYLKNMLINVGFTETRREEFFIIADAIKPHRNSQIAMNTAKPDSV